MGVSIRHVCTCRGYSQNGRLVHTCDTHVLGNAHIVVSDACFRCAWFLHMTKDSGARLKCMYDSYRQPVKAVVQIKGVICNGNHDRAGTLLAAASN